MTIHSLRPNSHIRPICNRLESSYKTHIQHTGASSIGNIVQLHRLEDFFVLFAAASKSNFFKNKISPTQKSTSEALESILE